MVATLELPSGTLASPLKADPWQLAIKMLAMGPALALVPCGATYALAEVHLPLRTLSGLGVGVLAGISVVDLLAAAASPLGILQVWSVNLPLLRA